MVYELDRHDRPGFIPEDNSGFLPLLRVLHAERRAFLSQTSRPSWCLTGTDDIARVAKGSRSVVTKWFLDAHRSDWERVLRQSDLSRQL